jgi:hypothetical protein
MLDLADYADRLINGFCFFVLNLVGSAVLLFVNPTKGILRLSSRYRLKLVKQASSLALIFYRIAVLSHSVELCAVIKVRLRHRRSIQSL